MASSMLAPLCILLPDQGHRADVRGHLVHIRCGRWQCNIQSPTRLATNSMSRACATPNQSRISSRGPDRLRLALSLVSRFPKCEPTQMNLPRTHRQGGSPRFPAAVRAEHGLDRDPCVVCGSRESLTFNRTHQASRCKLPLAWNTPNLKRNTWTRSASRSRLLGYKKLVRIS